MKNALFAAALAASFMVAGSAMAQQQDDDSMDTQPGYTQDAAPQGWENDAPQSDDYANPADTDGAKQAPDDVWDPAPHGDHMNQPAEQNMGHGDMDHDDTGAPVEDEEPANTDSE